MFAKLKKKIHQGIRFLTYDIWRIDKTGRSKKDIGIYNLIKTFILAVRNVKGSRLNSRAASLTYSTLLAIVPLLAVLFAIAQGFKFQNVLQEQMLYYFKGQEDVINRIIYLIDKSLEYAESNVFLGVGVVLLLYTIVSLFSKVEIVFNNIWQTPKNRSYKRMFTDYLALIIIAPVFFVVNAGLSIFLQGAAEQEVVGVVLSPLLQILPYLITVFLFTFMYIYVPNTKVKFTGALLAGIFAGISFQIFQVFYISGQIWISKYNAIYGSFAALPLLLLWLQLTWSICLFGVELSFAYQNLSKFDFEHETNNISKRYQDFIYLLIMTLIVKRFVEGGKPYTADELSEEYKIPTRLTSDTLFRLLEVGLIAETPSGKALIPAYLPSEDINHLTVAYLFDRLDMHGSEDFVIDTEEQFKTEWQTILDVRKLIQQQEGLILLKDL